MAPDRILAATRAGYAGNSLLTESKSTINGTSLAEMQELAAGVNLSMRMAFRAPGAKVIVPAMVHWKAGHFAALVTARDGRYLMQDPTFDDELWVSQRALHTEGSGYYLVPKGPLPAGWRAVESKEEATIWGKGAAAGTVNGNNGPPPQPSNGGNGGGGGAGGGECKG